MSDQEPVELDYDEIKYDTQEAKLFVIGGEEHWFGNKVVIDLDTDEKVVTIEYWLAYKLGLI